MSLAFLVLVASAATSARAYGQALDPDRNALADAPAPLADGDNPVVELDEAVAGLEDLSDEAALTPTARLALEAALSQIERARAEYLDLDRKPSRRFKNLFKALRRAQTELGEALDVTGSGAEALRIAQLRTDLSSLARLFATNFSELARNAGVDGAIVDRIDGALADAEAFVASGDHTKAAGSFGKALKAAEAKIKFSLATFDSQIFTRFVGSVTGIAYVISKNGVKLRDTEFGAARTDNDSPAISMTADSELNIASASKPITGVGLLKILQDHDISIDASIAPYLPSYWDVPSSIDDLSFRDLFTHHSGLNGFDGTPMTSRCGSTYGALKACIEAGIDPADQVPFAYQNSNYGMMRLLIAMIEYKAWIEGALPPGFCDTLEVACDSAYSTMTSQFTLSYMRCNVFEPMQLGDPGVEGCTDGPDVAPSTTDPTLAYSTLAADADGWLTDDHSTNFGGYGWHMSANQLARFIAYLRFSNTVLGPTQRAAMDQGYLGWMDPATFGAWVTGTFGTYRGHGGDWGDGGSPAREIHTCVMNFPDGYQVALVINSDHGLAGGTHQCDQLRLAYDAAWLPK